MKRFFFFVFILCLSLPALLSCDQMKQPSNENITRKLSFAFATQGQMYKLNTKNSVSSVFDEFYAKLVTGELVAEGYNITFTEVESGASYTFDGLWRDATVDLQAATYKVVGTSSAPGLNTQEKCSLFFDETITITNQMEDIILTAYYDCFLFVMTSSKLDYVDRCYPFAAKYWYTFVNGSFEGTLTGAHKDGSKFSVEMGEYAFEKGKYYIYDDVSINEYNVTYLLPTMDDGLANLGYVDLGLSVKWAAKNIGAENPEDGGEYYAWGEISTKNNYGWETYLRHSNGSESSITKYNNADGLTILDSSDDVATVRLGSPWRMPTYEEFAELIDACEAEWHSNYNGSSGYLFTASNGNSIFFPAAGFMYGNWNRFNGTTGDYWSKTRIKSYEVRAYYMTFAPDLTPYIKTDSDCGRDLGRMIRPVCD